MLDDKYLLYMNYWKVKEITFKTNNETQECISNFTFHVSDCLDD